ncbi:hypothetical protein ACEQPO_05060 [Bacillus sp. SL00103]
MRDGNPIRSHQRVGVNNDGDRKSWFYRSECGRTSRGFKETYEKSGIDPASIGYVEAHGTGTKMGDQLRYPLLAKCSKGRIADDSDPVL